MTDIVGHKGEAIAAKYYQQRGWLLLNHNYRTRMGEIDLILYKENTLVFAEVKTRAGTMLDRPAAAVDARKQQRLIWPPNSICSAVPMGRLTFVLMWWRSRPQAEAGRCIVFPAHLSAEKHWRQRMKGRGGHWSPAEPSSKADDGHRPRNP